MTFRSLRAATIAFVGVALIFGALTACRPSDVLDVPPPVGVIGSTTLHNRNGAEEELAGASAQLFTAVAGFRGLIEFSGLLTDEFSWASYGYDAPSANIDARFTSVHAVGSAFTEDGDEPLMSLLTARGSLLIAAGALRQYEPADGQSKVGEAYALTGYAELFLAEDYCAGVPLSAYTADGGFQYGVPLTTDSLLSVAESHFDSALKYDNANDTTAALASVGLGRTLLDRDSVAAAAAAVSSVPVGFVYNMPGGTSGATGNPNLYAFTMLFTFGCSEFNMSDDEGENGLNFVSGGDPRLSIDSTTQHATCDGGTWYFPAKFGDPSTAVPLATGVEAGLIGAEAALVAGDASTWAADLNGLRTNAPATYLSLAAPVPVLPADSTTTANAAERVDVTFRERAFWLFGTGTRQGDLRRLIRQYGRDSSTVFPTGPFVNGSNPNLPTPLPNYGPDVSFTLPTVAGGNFTANPYYKGCLLPTSHA